jgi:hypothetical protein
VVEPIKRKRGAPLGNHNATKHGYYAKGLNRAQQLEFSQAAGVSGLDEEIALLRVAVKKAAAGDNLKALFRAVNTLDKLIRTRYRVGNNGADDNFKRAVENLEKYTLAPLGIVPLSKNQTISNSQQNHSNATQSQSNGQQMPDKPKQIGTLNKSKQITQYEADLP